MNAQIIELILAEGDGEKKLFFMGGGQNGKVMVNLTQAERDSKKIKGLVEFLAGDVIAESKAKLDDLAETIKHLATADEKHLSPDEVNLQKALTEAFGFCQLLENVRSALKR